MKNKWRFIGPIFVLGIALQLYGLMFAKRNSPQMWIAMALSVVCIIVYYVKRIKYINSMEERGDENK